MKDFRGIERGQCKLCGHCSEYLPPQPGSDGKHKCATCSCPPGRHASTTSPTRQPVSTPKDGAATSTDFIPSAVTRLDGLTTTVIGSCVVPGCGNNVDFNPNTGEEYLHCQDHSGVDLTVLAQLSHQLLAQGGDTGNIGGEDSITMTCMHVVACTQYCACYYGTFPGNFPLMLVLVPF